MQPICVDETCIILQANSLLNNNNLSNETIVNGIVEELINISKPSLMPPSLELIIRILSTITKILENINSTDKVNMLTGIYYVILN